MATMMSPRDGALLQDATDQVERSANQVQNSAVWGPEAVKGLSPLLFAVMAAAKNS
uniref:OSJNBb0089K06.22 protein n=2 Tax=Oryza TaxID=4527 RepID=Q7XNZ1_ORYSJ|nr:OSJNBb0089K06.22 [Oryza sativa Japonica Group]CAI44601.1 P0650D04.5 [Oryza sativa Japonica Group]